jgi:DNA invertase Pin-like site-specific DNA recombinase
MASGSFVSYLRVSTDKQGRSGLGLEAQREAVRQYLNGGQWELVKEFVEVESGKRADRPQLAKAMRLCKLTGATLVIAKLDRLSRDAHFLLGLQKAGVEFVAADNPHANRLTIHILAAVAEDEATRISERTRAALAAAKARGVKLGNPRGSAHLAGLGNGSAVAAVKAKAQARAEDLADVVADIRAGGATSTRAIAAELTKRGMLTPRGGQWHATSVANLLARIDAQA